MTIHSAKGLEFEYVYIAGAEEDLFPSRLSVSTLEDIINITVDYGPIMRFTVEDEKKRAFIAERYCFLGSVDDWIIIGESDSLKNLVKKYIKHLDQDSFFDLF